MAGIVCKVDDARSEHQEIDNINNNGQGTVHTGEQEEESSHIALHTRGRHWVPSLLRQSLILPISFSGDSTPSFTLRMAPCPTEPFTLPNAVLLLCAEERGGEIDQSAVSAPLIPLIFTPQLSRERSSNMLFSLNLKAATASGRHESE